LLLSGLLWLFTTTGGRQIFVKEVLGGAYDSQAEHFLRGDVDVDVDAIGHEAMIVNGKVRMYFGAFPALLRIPLNFLYPAGHGKWSRISGFCAGMIALFAFASLVRIALRSSPLSSRARNWLGNACVIGFALGSPLLLLLGNLSIYDEAIIWGFALSLAAIFFVFRSRQSEGRAATRALLGFSICAGGALLSRVTFGAPFLLIGLFLALGIRRGNRMTNLAALILPLGAALIFYTWLSYARFGSLTGVNFDYYINPVHSEFAHKFGVFSPRRIPTASRTILACASRALSASRLSWRQIAIPITTPLCTPTTSAKSISLSRGLRAGLFSVRSWEFHVCFDAKERTSLSRASLWPFLSNFSASYHIICLPNVMPLICVLS